jgi:hypothetical protein
MASNIPPPPPGFAKVGTVPPPPEGFALPDRERFNRMLQSGELAPVNAAEGGIGPQFQKGLVQGMGGLVSFPAQIGEYLGSKATQGIDYMLGTTPSEQPEIPRSPINPLTVGNAISDSTGIGPANTTGEKYANTIGQFLPGVLMGRPTANIGPMAPKATTAVSAAIGSEAAGQAAENYMPGAEPYARLAGALVGGVAPDVARRIATPFPISADRQHLVDVLRREGVELTPGQSTGRNSLRYAEGELGGGRVAQIMDDQAEQFTAAALRRAGINANRATPDVIDDAFTRLGNEFDGLAARNNLPPDPRIATDVAAVVTDYTNLVPQTARAPAIQGLAQDMLAAAQNGLPGNQYQAITSRLARMVRNTTDPQTRAALNGMRDALDDAMERSLRATGSPDAGALRNVRNQYRNLMVIEQAATGAGENAAQGLVSPSQLRNATVSKQGRRNYARGDGDFAELSRAGEATMKALPNSGTAGRTAARNLGTGITTILGTMLGGATGNLPLTALGGLAGAAAPSALGRAMLSGPGRAYLSNQVFAGARNLTPAQRALISALGANTSVANSKN